MASSEPSAPRGAEPDPDDAADGTVAQGRDNVRGPERDREARRRGGRRRRLDREQIVAAGLAYVDEHGVRGLSMRQLGGTLEVEAMALYRYTAGKDDLLDAIADLLVAQMRNDPEIHGAPCYAWQDFLRLLAHGVRSHALAHPRAFPLLAARPTRAPWLRPPLGDLAWAESILSRLSTAGFDDAAAVAAYRSMASFLLGHLLHELRIGHHVSAPAAHDQPLPHAAPPGDDPRERPRFTTVHRMRPQLGSERWAAEFDESLEGLLARTSPVTRR